MCGAGKHVLVEKPLALNADEAAHMVHLSGSLGPYYHHNALQWNTLLTVAGSLSPYNHHNALHLEHSSHCRACLTVCP